MAARRSMLVEKLSAAQTPRRSPVASAPLRMTAMYETCFGFSHRPFAPAPHADRYVPTASLEHARQALVRSIDRGQGPGLIVGPAGSGKSILLQVLAEYFRSRFLVALLASSRLCT